MYLLEMLHEMLTQLIKLGLLEMFCGNMLFNLLQPSTATVVCIREGEDYNQLGEV